MEFKRGAHLELNFAKDGIMSRVVIAYIFLTRILLYPRGDRDYPIILVGTRYSKNPKYRDIAKCKRPHKPLSMSDISSNHGRVFQDNATSWGITYSKITLDLLPNHIQQTVWTTSISDMKMKLIAHIHVPIIIILISITNPYLLHQ